MPQSAPAFEPFHRRNLGRTMTRAEIAEDVAWYGGEDAYCDARAAAFAELDAESRSAANDNSPKSGAKPAAKGAPLPIVNPADWFGKPVPQREWFLEGLIPSRTVTILSGDGGVGKSLLALQIAAAAAMGVDTLGLSPKPGRVLYLGAEDDIDEFQRRLADIVVLHGRTLADLTDMLLVPMADRDALLAIPDGSGVIQPTANWNALKSRIAKHEPAFIVLDTSADLYGGDEIKRSQVRGFVGMLRALALETNAAVLLLSHPSVAGITTGTGSSGSTAWNNSVRSRLYLTAPTGDGTDSRQRTLTIKKSNYGEAGDGIKMRWQAGGFIADDGLPAADVAFVRQHQDTVFLDLLAKVNGTGQRVAPTKGTNYAPKIIAARPDAKGSTLKGLEEAMQRLMAAGTIKVIKVGPPSKGWQNLIITAADSPPDGN